VILNLVSLLIRFNKISPFLGIVQDNGGPHCMLSCLSLTIIIIIIGYYGIVEHIYILYNYNNNFHFTLTF